MDSAVGASDLFMNNFDLVVWYTSSTELYPNPTQNSLNLELNLKTASTVKLSMLDVSGKNIKTMMPEERVESGVQVLNFDLNASTPSGFYYINIETNSASFMKPFVLQK